SNLTRKFFNRNSHRLLAGSSGRGKLRPYDQSRKACATVLSLLAPRSSAMERSLEWLLSLYNPNDALERASTIPSPWYFEPRIAELENEGVLARTWQVAGRADQVKGKGDFFTADVAGEPVVVVRGQDDVLRAFYNVCRHHAAAVV